MSKLELFMILMQSTKKYLIFPDQYNFKNVVQMAVHTQDVDWFPIRSRSVNYYKECCRYDKDLHNAHELTMTLV